jgi:hypothetical protein
MNRRSLLAAVPALLAVRTLGAVKAGTRVYAVVCRQLAYYIEACEFGCAERGLDHGPDDLVVIGERQDRVEAGSPFEAALETLHRVTTPCRERLREVHAPDCIQLEWERDGLASNVRRTGPGSWRYDNGSFIFDVASSEVVGPGSRRGGART